MQVTLIRPWAIFYSQQKTLVLFWSLSFNSAMNLRTLLDTTYLSIFPKSEYIELYKSM